jgi:cytochrome P450/NADPH-cytochrome P450 reductase
MAPTTKPIPQPPPKLLVGNLFDIDADVPSISLAKLIKQYGPLVKLKLINREFVIAGGQKYVHELCDQTRFEKIVKGALDEVRSLAGDGGLVCAGVA